MAIKIKELSDVSNNLLEKKYLYKDLSLDLSFEEVVSPGYSTAIRGGDIKPSYDIAAIKNSLQNLFNTLPGQRFLFPEYGLDLYQFLFTQITEFNGQILGDKVFNSIKQYEPRVIPRKVNVILDPDNNQYLLNIIISVPQFDTTTVIDFALDIKQQTFILLPSSRNR